MISRDTEEQAGQHHQHLLALLTGWHPNHTMLFPGDMDMALMDWLAPLNEILRN